MHFHSWFRLLKFIKSPYHFMYWLSQKRFMRLEGCGIESTWLIFKIRMLFYQSKVNLDVEILFRNASRLMDPDITKMQKRDLYGNQSSTFHSGL